MANTAILNGTGSSARVQFSQRADGQWFTRVQTMGRRGFVWTAWRACVAPDLSRTYSSPYTGQARLPKAVG